jgi:hypothetical protein
MGSTAKFTWLVRNLALFSLIFFLNSVAISANTKVQNRGVAKKPRLAGTVNLQDYGAIGDGSTDVGPALQRALDDLAAAGGGTLVVPAGGFYLATPVSKQFAAGVSVTITGDSPGTPIDVAGNGLGLNLGAKFIVAVGAANNALTLQGLDSLLLKDIAFMGVEAVLSDAAMVVSLSEIKQANIVHCEFYGLASYETGKAVLSVDHSDLNLQQTAFLGCSTNNHVVIVTNWLGVLVRDSKFIDYGQSDFYGKTPYGCSYSWIGLGDPAALDPSWSRREAVYDNVFLDEGAWFQLSAIPDQYTPAYRPFDFYLTRINMNVNNLFSDGIYIRGAQGQEAVKTRVFIDRSRFGWSSRAGYAVDLVNVGDSILDLIDTDVDATRLLASGNNLAVINSDFASIESPGIVPRVFSTATAAEDPAQYVRQQYLNVLQHDPDPAGHFYWTKRQLLCDMDQVCVTQTRNALASFLAAGPPAKVSACGTVFDENGVPLSGVNVSLTGSQSVAMETDVRGRFSFQRLASAGEYVLTPTKNHYVFSNSTIVTPTGDQTRVLTGTLLRHTISGHISTSTGQDLAGVTVTLSGSEAATVTTDDKGNFCFPSLPGGGNYTLSVARANYDFSDSNQSFLDLSGDQLCSFTGTLRSYTVSGVVSTSKDEVSKIGLEGVRISVVGAVSATTFTNSKGGYSLVLPGEGDYTIAPSKTNYQFVPKNLVITNLSSNQTIDFSATPKAPMLLAGSDSTRLLALDAVLRTIEPFALSYDHDWSEDQRTRVVLFATNFELEPEDTNSDFVVEVEDGSHRVYPLRVETANTIRLDDSIVCFVVRLSDDLTDVGDVKLRLAYKGTYSDPLLIAIGHRGTGSSN